jgi:hypothetical protein
METVSSSGTPDIIHETTLFGNPEDSRIQTPRYENLKYYYCLPFCRVFQKVTVSELVHKLSALYEILGLISFSGKPSAGL